MPPIRPAATLFAVLSLALAAVAQPPAPQADDGFPKPKAAAANPAAGGDPDPVLMKLEAAKKAYAESHGKARAALLAAFDKAVKEVAETGVLDAVRKLQAEQQAFADEGRVPTSPRMLRAAADYERDEKQAWAALDRAYDAAVRESTKALKVDQAESVRAEWKDATARMNPGKAPAAAGRPALPQTRDELRRALAGSEWWWGDTESLTFRRDGLVGNAAWDPRGLVTRWEVVDRRTIILLIEKGRDHNRLAVLTFADDLDSFTGVGFEGILRVKPSRRKK